MATNHVDFDLNIVADSFVECLKIPGNVIDMDLYLQAYEELNKFFEHMGKVFHFVAADVSEKIGILRAHRRSDVGSHYATVQGMIDYEVENNITDIHQKGRLLSGSRTLLRLHRALEFISDLLDRLSSASLEEHLSKIAHKSYYSTLSVHHPWLVRSGVNIALYTLPSVGTILHKMQPGKEVDQKEASEVLQRVVKAAQPVYSVVQETYTKSDLLNLP